jgi:ABC-type polar amino acid transport system ATPase subunit
MNAKLVIKNFGAIKDATINVTDFTVLTGAQSSGKSTIAKLIYFFQSTTAPIVEIDDNFRLLFDQALFNDDTHIEYTDDHKHITFSNLQFVAEQDTILLENPFYIPAGRSIMTLLGEQLASFYLLLDDGQKNTLDLCLRKYIDSIILMRPEFKNGLRSLKRFNLPMWEKQEARLDFAKKLIESFIQGEYRYWNGVETLTLANGRSLPVSSISSGQQDSLWLLNILFYYMLKGNNKFFIIEEPESSLFPEWQKKIVEFISLVHSAGFPMLITTHSPYVLAAINNIRYATNLREKGKKVDHIIPKEYAIYNLSASFINDGYTTNIIDDETDQLDNQYLDEISIPLSDDFYALMDIEMAVENVLKQA